MSRSGPPRRSAVGDRGHGGQAFESFLTDARGLGPLQRHSPEQRKEIGAAIQEFRDYAAKRRESATNRIYF